MRCKILLERFYLCEMSVEDARKVLGLTPDNNDLEKAYHKMALKYHPDRGGSEEMMKKINQAKDVLDKTNVFTTGPSAYRPSYAEMKKRNQEKNQTLLINFMADFNRAIKKYKDYFEQFTKMNDPIVTEQASEDSIIAFEIKFKMTSVDNQTDVILGITAYAPTTSALGTDNSDYTYYYTTSVLHAGRDYRMAKNKYNARDSFKVLQKPEMIFPESKIKAILSGQKRNKLTRKSFVRELEHRFPELKPTNNPDSYMLAAKEEGKYIGIQRSVLTYRGRFVTWQVISYYDLEGRSFKHNSKAKYVSIAETDEGMEVLTQAIRDAVNMKPWHHTDKDKEELIKSTLTDQGESLCSRLMFKYGHLYEYENDYTFKHVDAVISYFENKYGKSNIMGPYIAPLAELRKVFNTNTPFNKVAKYEIADDDNEILTLYVAIMAPRRDISVSGVVTAVTDNGNIVYAVDDSSKTKADVNKLKDY